ncbi:MAG TPA: CBS domain-containing protein [Methylomirabilota bacterium]
MTHTARPEPSAATAEYHDEYSETLGTEVRKLQDALLSDTVGILATPEPIRLAETVRIEAALEAMLAQDRVAVVVVDEDGRLRGIATDRDLLKRALARDRDRAKATLGAVMTRDPQVLRPDDRICYAVNRMMAMGCRTVPVVDAERRPVGIVTIDDIAKWLAALFPEAILNLRPGDRLKQPAERDGG